MILLVNINKQMSSSLFDQFFDHSLQILGGWLLWHKAVGTRVDEFFLFFFRFFRMRNFNKNIRYKIKIGLNRTESTRTGSDWFDLKIGTEDPWFLWFIYSVNRGVWFSPWFGPWSGRTPWNCTFFSMVCSSSSINSKRWFNLASTFSSILIFDPLKGVQVLVLSAFGETPSPILWLHFEWRSTIFVHRLTDLNFLRPSFLVAFWRTPFHSFRLWVQALDLWPFL